MLKKIIIKHSSLKEDLNLNITYISIILSVIKSFIKSTTFLLIFYNFFIFNVIIRNKKTILKYYKKKIIKNLLEANYLLTLNTYKTIIINLKLSL